ncbi:MAG: AbrB/MazE/SpoVT family DNA-binding domain-containing protein [Planctomycetes bacterium]|nr:AbrB/MazE/SpoVT family DNA-binding domain-containing protein [Planctomycetota bacterium]
MVTTVMTMKGQVVIPSKVRHRLGIKNGTRLCVMEQGDKIILQPLTDEYFKKAAGILADGKKLTRKLLDERARDKGKEDR